jgi:hypothetical protein
MMWLRRAMVGLLLTVSPPAMAETAFIAQVNVVQINPGMPITRSAAVSQPLQVVPVPQYGPQSMSYVPTPEMSGARNGNLARTIEVGSFNRVFQSQSGGNNFSNVAVLGGKDNNVGVWQGGKDLSNLNLINTQGLSIAVIQPPGAAPLNMLIARLPNGGLLIKR